MSLTHLGCPSCGGTLSLAEGQRIVACRYCAGESLVLIPGTVPRSVVTLGVTREEARAAAQAFLSGPGVPWVVRERGRIQDVSLCYVPFYEFTGVRLGTFLLRETVKPPPPLVQDGEQGGDLQPWLFDARAEKEDTRVIQQEFVRIKPACELPELGVGRIPLEEMRRGKTPLALEPYDPVGLQSRATVFAPTKPPARFAEESQLRIKAEGDRTGIVEQWLKLLYYPVWQARYRHLGRMYEIAVDGVAGVILRARIPADIRHAAGVAAGSLALVALCLGRLGRQLVGTGAVLTGTRVLQASSEGILPALFLGGALGLFLAWVGWRTFRRGGELLVEQEAAEPILGAGWGSGPMGELSGKLAAWLLSPGGRSWGKG